MRQLSHTREIFAQLAETDGASGVETIVENHDAWVKNDAIQGKISAAMRAQLARAPRSEQTLAKILRQREALAGVVTKLPMRHSSVG